MSGSDKDGVAAKESALLTAQGVMPGQYSAWMSSMGQQVEIDLSDDDDDDDENEEFFDAVDFFVDDFESDGEDEYFDALEGDLADPASAPADALPKGKHEVAEETQAAAEPEPKADPALEIRMETARAGIIEFVQNGLTADDVAQLEQRRGEALDECDADPLTEEGAKLAEKALVGLKRFARALNNERRAAAEKPRKKLQADFEELPKVTSDPDDLASREKLSLLVAEAVKPGSTDEQLLEAQEALIEAQAGDEKAKAEVKGRSAWANEMARLAKSLPEIITKGDRSSRVDALMTMKEAVQKLTTYFKPETAGFAALQWALATVRADIKANKDARATRAIAFMWQLVSVKSGTGDQALAAHKLTKAKLWEFCGYKIKGQEWTISAKRRATAELKALHLTVSADAMAAVANNPAGFFEQSTEVIFGGLFTTAPPHLRVHMSREMPSLPNQHCYVGGVKGNGATVAPEDFDGDGEIMLQEVGLFQQKIKRRFEVAKMKGWQL